MSVFEDPNIDLYGVFHSSVTGLSRWGKSEFMIEMIRQQPNTYPYAIFVNPDSENTNLNKEIYPDRKLRSSERIFTTNHLPLDPKKPKILIQFLLDHKKINWDCDNPKLINTMLGILFNLKKSQKKAGIRVKDDVIYLHLDELSLYQYQPKKEVNYIRAIMDHGLKLGLRAVISDRRMQEIDQTIFRKPELNVSFGMHRADRSYFKQTQSIEVRKKKWVKYHGVVFTQTDQFDLDPKYGVISRKSIINDEDDNDE